MKQDLDISNVESKRKRKRIEKSKYDAVMADLAQTSRYADELFQKLEQAVAERDRLQADNAELRKDNDIWRKAGRKTEQQKEKALAIIELQGIEIEKSNNSWEAIISAYNSLSKEVDDAKDECDYLKKDRDVLIAKAANHAHLDTLASKLRDQRDMAVYVAVAATICALVLSLAVWFGALVPKI